MSDYIIVGAGLSGSIIAHYLAEDMNKKVTVLERRDHIAGNVYDYLNDAGILVQKYGPHIFHTNKKRVEEYVKKWGEWEDFHLECMVYMNGKYTPSPFNFQTIDDYFEQDKAEEIKQHIRLVYGDAEKATIVDMLQVKDPVVKEYAQYLFDNDYSLYTAKQWGIKPEEIDVNVLKRVPVLFSYKTGYFDDTYQAMPLSGFTKVVEGLLDHPNITVKLNCDAVKLLDVDLENNVITYQGKQVPVIYTGAIDELFQYQYGKLPYRSLRFEWRNEECQSYQKAPVVAYPQEKGYTRITEYSKLPIQEGKEVTTLAVEYPLPVNEGSDIEPYYPIPTDTSLEAYGKYRKLADSIHNISLCGRLAEYQYYNMDQVIEKALEFCDRLHV